MRTMIFSDLASMRSSLLVSAGLCLFVGIFLCVAMANLSSALACVCIMLPMLYVINVCAYDEQNGWMRFRLTLPISRRQTVFGRYASAFVVALAMALAAGAVAALAMAIAGALPAGVAPESLLASNNPAPAVISAMLTVLAFFFLASALMLPLFMRFGMNMVVRLIPAVAVIAILALVAWASEGFLANLPVADLMNWLDDESGLHLLMASGIALAASLAIYGASALIAAKIYESRQL